MFFECTQVPGAVGVIHGAVLGIRGLVCWLHGNPIRLDALV